VYSGAPVPTLAIHREDSRSYSNLKRRFALEVKMLDPEFALIRKLVRSHPQQNYKSIEIKDIWRNHDLDEFVIRVRGEGSSYCQNVGRGHDHNTIYFKLRADGLRQRCFCCCPTTEGRLNGLCSKYSSNPVKVSQEDLQVLFPGPRVEPGAAADQKCQLEQQPSLSDIFPENENLESTPAALLRTIADLKEHISRLKKRKNSSTFEDDSEYTSPLAESIAKRQQMGMQL
jgi:hypothetical protein